MKYEGETQRPYLWRYREVDEGETIFDMLLLPIEGDDLPNGAFGETTIVTWDE